MKNIKVTLPDNSVKDIAIGTTPQGVADEIGPGLARAVVVAKVDGELKDLNSQLKSDCSLELFSQKLNTCKFKKYRVISSVG